MRSEKHALLSVFRQGYTAADLLSEVTRLDLLPETVH